MNIHWGDLHNRNYMRYLMRPEDGEDWVWASIEEDWVWNMVFEYYTMDDQETFLLNRVGQLEDIILDLSTKAAMCCNNWSQENEFSLREAIRAAGFGSKLSSLETRERR